MASLVLVAGLALFAQALLEAQSRGREEVEKRFADRAAVTASLIESLFATTAQQGAAEQQRRLGGRTVDQDALVAFARESRLAYAVVLDQRGRTLASTPGTPRAATARLARRPASIRAVSRGRVFSITGILRSARGGGVMEYASAFEARGGTRILVQGFESGLVSPLLSSYLRRIPNPDRSSAYVLDRAGRLVAASRSAGRAGSPAPERGLATAVRGGESRLASFESGGQERTFVSAAVPNTAWQVVLSTRSSDLYAPVSGIERWVPWVIFLALAATGTAALLLLRRTLADAATLRLANRQLERRAAELQRSNAELEQFAYVASHDLQEPLRKVQAFGDLLASRHADALPDPAQDYLRRMRNAAGRMSRLIDDLLVFSRVSTNTRPFERLDLTRVAQDVTQDLEAQIGAAGADVHVTRLPVVDADPLQMRQLLQNLVSNAVKFRSDDRAPTVRIDGRTEDGCAVVTVADDGIGFDERYADRIFRVFERLHGRDEYEGTGIGLALCRKIAERHGGSITASSTPGQGTTMTIRLPLHHPEAEPAHGDPEPTPREHLTHA